jgi:hypothetical protein
VLSSPRRSVNCRPTGVACVDRQSHFLAHDAPWFPRAFAARPATRRYRPRNRSRWPPTCPVSRPAPPPPRRAARREAPRRIRSWSMSPGGGQRAAATRARKVGVAGAGRSARDDDRDRVASRAAYRSASSDLPERVPPMTRTIISSRFPSWPEFLAGTRA